MTATLTGPRIVGFDPSGDRACASAWACEGVKVGVRAAFVDFGDGVPQVHCGPCTERVGLGEQAPTSGPPAEESTPAVGEPSTAAVLCACPRCTDGGPQNGVQCMGAQAEIGTVRVVRYQHGGPLGILPASICAAGCGTAIKPGDRAGRVGKVDGTVCSPCLDVVEENLAQGGEPYAGLRIGPRCTCTDRRAEGFTNAGTEGAQRWVHAACGLPAAPPELADPESAAWLAGERSEVNPIAEQQAVEAAVEKGTADDRPRRSRARRTPAAGGDPEGGEPARAARRKVRGSETASGGAQGGARGCGEGDQGGDVQRLPRGVDGHDADLLGTGGAAAPAPGGLDATRPEGDESGVARDLRAVGEAVDSLDAGPREVTAGAAPATGHTVVAAPARQVVVARGPVSASPSEFMAAEVPAAPVATVNGNTAWAQRYARELRKLVTDYANRSERNLQSHLGPSEIGHSCHRQVAGKLAHLPTLNHVTDPWPSIMGVAGHAWMEDAFGSANQPGAIRFLTERKVRPDMGFEAHPGTGDGYDATEQAVVDHKFLGRTSMAKLRTTGAPRHYFVQTLLYARGFIALGLPVRRVALLAWPRTSSTLDDLYVWDHEITEADWAFLRDTIEPELRYRKQWAAALVTGAAQLLDVPADTADDCHFCPFYRPQTSRDGGPGCPGHATGQQ